MLSLHVQRKHVDVFDYRMLDFHLAQFDEDRPAKDAHVHHLCGFHLKNTAMAGKTCITTEHIVSCSLLAFLRAHGFHCHMLMCEVDWTFAG